MKKYKFKRCFTKHVVTERGTITLQYNVNHCLISASPEIPAKIMSLYRGTGLAALEDLAADLGGYIDE